MYPGVIHNHVQPQNSNHLSVAINHSHPFLPSKLLKTFSLYISARVERIEHAELTKKVATESKRTVQTVPTMPTNAGPNSMQTLSNAHIFASSQQSRKAFQQDEASHAISERLVV